MQIHCPYCKADKTSSDPSPHIVRRGFFYRKSDSQRVQRFQCYNCTRAFSRATLHPCFRQKKRHKNSHVLKNFCSGVSQRRMARNLNLNRKTVARKLIFLGTQAPQKLEDFHKQFAPATMIEFDDLETIEHTKCKPLSVTLALESYSRRILGVEVSRMPAKGYLAEKSRMKYGPRPDERAQGRENLFNRIKALVSPQAIIKSDQNPHYIPDVKKHFPQATHLRFKGRKPLDTGQGELKKGAFDPIFSLNHTFAKSRDDIKRLARKNWGVSKKAEYLQLHLNLFALYHNTHLNLV